MIDPRILEHHTAKRRPSRRQPSATREDVIRSAEAREKFLAIAGGEAVYGTHGNPIETWKQALGSGPGRMLDVIIKANGITREQLAHDVDMTASGGTFQTYLSRLRSNGLIRIADGMIFPDEVLWR